MTTIIFLDFDDVLAIHRRYNSFQVKLAFENFATDDYPELWVNLFEARATKNLLALHDEFSPLYVITSSWTGFLSNEQVIEALNRAGAYFVATNLHCDWQVELGDKVTRLDAVRVWLETHSNTERFVILDDPLSGASLQYSELDPWCVFCEPWRGFDAQRLKLAQEILRKPLQPMSRIL